VLSSAIGLVERSLVWKNRVTGVGYHPDPLRYFDEGGVEEAERRCLDTGRDFLAFLRAPADLPSPAVERILTTHGRQTLIRLRFRSPLPQGEPANHQVRMRLYLPEGTKPGDPVAMFHHPIYQRRWELWEWFLADLRHRMPVAILAAPNHFERVAPGWFPGQGTCNANPWRFYEAIRQWSWDQQAAMDLLRAEGLRPAAAVGFSLGAFQTLLVASAGGLGEMPIVTIACANRYGHGLLKGVLGRSIVASMRRVGIDAPRLQRMVAPLSLERHVRVLRGRPILALWGMFDPVDPQPSGKRLLAALRPTRSVPLPAGHGSLLLFRRKIAQEMRAFFARQFPALRS
jgi:hypothetical protein